MTNHSPGLSAPLRRDSGELLQDLPLHLPLRRVLCAVRTLQAAPEALRRARSMATALHAELRLLHVLEEPLFWSPLFPQLSTEAASSQVERCTALLEELWRICSMTEGGPLDAEDVVLASGDFVEEVWRAALEMRADLIVLADEEGLTGKQATRIARDTQVPVLIARHHRPSDVIVAATDLSDARYPIIRGAARLGQQLAARLVLLHNVPPQSASAPMPEPWLPVFLEDTPNLNQTWQRLRALADRYSPQAGTIVASQVDAADAILAAARSRDADIVVLGTRHRSWLERLLHGSIAARVIDTVKGSVLILPLDGEVRAPAPVLAPA